MSTATRLLPPHGTEYRYRGPQDGSWPGCRCDACKQAQSRGGKTRRWQHHRGQGPLHPGGPVVAHIRTLHDSGMSFALIARRAKVSDASITYLVRGLTKNPKRDAALRILAVRPRDFDANAIRPAFASIRRVQALYVIGHNPRSIAAATGLDPYTISQVANERYTIVKPTTALAIRTAYPSLLTHPGPSVKARRRATALGWVGPLGWDDIDDPAAMPDVDEHADKRGRPAQIDDQRVERLTRQGLTAEQIARDLGCHIRTVVRARRRMTTNDLKEAA